MEPVHEALQILKKAMQIEAAMRAPGGIRISEERELHAMRDWLNRYPSVVETIQNASRALQVPVQALSLEDIGGVGG